MRQAARSRFPDKEALVRVGLWSSLLLATFALLFVGRSHTWTTGDTKTLVSGIPAMNRCLSHGVFWNCNHYAASNHLLPVSKFPLLQSLPSSVLHSVGFTQPAIIGALQWINDFAIIISIALVIRWFYRRSATGGAVICGLLLVPGMLIAYSVQTFSELLAAAVFMGLVISGLRSDRVSPYLLPLAVIATLSKETAAPFVLAFGLAAITLSAARPPVRRRSVVTLISGVLLGELLNISFNLFKYGTLLNHVYLNEPRSSHVMAVINVAALLIAPNAGIIWFWPGVAIAGGILFFQVYRSCRSGDGDLEVSNRRRVAAAAAITGAAFLAYVVSLALWWDPTGWYSWGPRLLLPAAAPTIVLALACIPELALGRRWLRLRVAIPVGLLAIAILVPTMGTSFGTENQSSMYYATWSYRPECVPQIATPGSRIYESCERTEQWRPVGMPLVESIPRSLWGQEGYWLALACACFAVFFALLSGRRSVRRSGEELSPLALLDQSTATQRQIPEPA
jgi:hypothetical protein